MKKLSFPNRITVELTNECNVSCTFCNRQKIQMELGFMSKELYYKIIDEAAQHLPVKLVPFFRGEPLMHPDIIEFIKYAKSKGLGPIQIASNALLLDEKMQDELIDAGIDFISFSLDTLDSNIYKHSRQLGDLEISSRNVESFCIKCMKRKENGLEAPTVQVSTVDIEEYRATQNEFIEKWRQFADIVRVYEQHDEKGRFARQETAEKLDIFDERKPCRKVFTDMIIYWDGRLALCNYDWDEKREIGDISKMTIQQAWDSVEYEKIRKMHFDNCFDESICKECQHWKIDYVDSGFLGKSFCNIDCKEKL